MTEQAQIAAVELGQKAISYQQGVVDLTVRPKTKAQRLQMNMLDAVGKHTGLNFVVVENMKDEGFYKTGSNQVVLSLGSSKGLMLRTAGHETYHYVKENMSDKASEIETFVLDTLKKNKGEKWVNDRLKYYEKLGYKGKQAQIDELVADSLFDAFTNKRAVEQFAEKNQSLAKRISRHIKKLIADIKNIINKLKASGDYAEIKAWQDDLASLEKLNNMFLDVLDELAEKKADVTTETKNTADEVKSKSRNVITKSDVNAAQSIGRKSINSLSFAELNSLSAFAEKYWNELGVKSPFFRAWFGDWRENDQTPVVVANIKGASKGLVTNKDTGWNINISRIVFNETFNHKQAQNINARPYVQYIRDIIEKSVLLESHGIDPKKSDNSLLMHSFYAIADIGNGQEVLKLYVEEMFDPNSDDTNKRAYQLQTIEKQQLAVTGSGKPLSVSMQTVAVKSVADLFELVKQNDKNFSPKPASKVVNPGGTPKVMYHGTQNDFYVFDENRIGQGATLFASQGYGFYFTESKQSAPIMPRERVVESFLNVKNPFKFVDKNNLDVNKALSEFAEKTGKSFDIKEYENFSAFEKRTGAVLSRIVRNNGKAFSDFLKEKGYDGVIYTSYDYENNTSNKCCVVFEPTQIKSATDNIGTFDEKQEDIRHSRKRTVASGKKKSYNKNSYYNEFDSLAMRWRNKADTQSGDMNIISGKGGFVLLEATDYGYTELARGTWSDMKELKAEYEQAHKETDKTVYEHYDSYGFDEGADDWNLQLSENGTDGNGNSENISRRRLQTDTERSNEYRRLGDKEKLIKSVSREPSISEEASNYILDTKEYREVLGVLERRFNTLGKVKLSPKAIDRYAGRLLQKSKSNYSREQLTERLTALFDFIANSREVTWEEVTEIAANIAKDKVNGIIRTCPKASLFAAFRRFGIERRQPSCNLNNQKSAENSQLLGRRIFTERIFGQSRHKTEQILSDLRVF